MPGLLAPFSWVRSLVGSEIPSDPAPTAAARDALAGLADAVLARRK